MQHNIAYDFKFDTFNFKDNKISCYKGNCENYLENYEYVTNLVNKLF